MKKITEDKIFWEKIDMKMENEGRKTKEKMLLIVAVTFFLFLVSLVSAELNYTTGEAVYTNFTWQPAVINDSFTVSAWINLYANTTNYPVYSTDGYIVSVNLTKLDIKLLNSENTTEFAGTSSLVSQSWNHVVYIYNGTNVIFYLNGNFEIFNYSSGYFNGTNNLSGVIGNSYPYFFNGSIDEVRIYNRTLTQAEITTLYNNKFTSNATIVNSSGLVAYYDFQNSDGNATRLVDVGTGINNGTIYGAVWTSNEAYGNGFVSYASGSLVSTVGVVVTLVDGIYNWFYDIFDFAGNKVTTGNNSFTVDTTFPLINFTSPTPTNNSGASGSFSANVSLTELNLANITWRFNNTNYVYGGNYSLTSPVNLTQGLVLLMNFDNESAYGENATNVVDFSGNGNNGTVYGNATWNSTGKYGGAYTFDGVNSAIRTTATNFTNSFTLSTWVNLNSPNNTNFFTKHGAYSFGIDYQGYLEFIVWMNNVSYTLETTSSVSQNTWTFVSAKFENGVLKIYNNAVLVNSTDFSAYGTQIDSSSNDGFIGGLADSCSGNMSYINKLNGYCIDQYEASMPSANSTTIGNSSDVARIANPGTMMAVSQGGVIPWVSVNQTSARTACSNAGKHLCTDEEWLGAANINGSLYNLPTDLSASPYFCNTNTACSGSYANGNACDTGAKTNCKSAENVYDMVGNVWEWTNETVGCTNSYVGGTEGWKYWNGTTFTTTGAAGTAKYGNDGVYFLAGTQTGRAVLRGGSWSHGAAAGPFSASLSTAPSDTSNRVGFRCCSSSLNLVSGILESKKISNYTTGYQIYTGINYLYRKVNGSIDEVAIWNRSLSANEIKQLYQSQIKKYYNTNEIYLKTDFNITNGNSSMKIYSSDGLNWNLLVNQSGLGIGSSYNYLVRATDLVNNINSTETRTVKGNTVPTFISISYAPNDSDSLDPGAVIVVTTNISDTDNNFDSAILQWKNSTGVFGENNVTMENLTAKGFYTLLNASFTLPNYESNRTFRIVANDTTSDLGYSNNYTLQSLWDCSWKSTEDLSSTAGWDENKFIGNITINNTGDPQFAVSNCSLDFRLNHDLVEGRICFGSSCLKPSNTYSISAKSNQTILINATFGTEVKQENVIITTTEVTNTIGISSTRSRNTTATIVSNQAGPYLYQKMTSYPMSVYLTTENFSLQGYLRNLMGSTTVNENNTAYNVSFYWTLPSGLTNASGNLSMNYTNLTDNNLNYNNIYAGFSSLASMNPGVQEISLNSYGYNSSGSLIIDAGNNSLLTNKINVSFLCYNVTDGVCVTACGYLLDPDCSAPSPSPSGGGGGGGGGGGTGTVAIATSAEYQLVRGEQNEVKIIFENKDANESLRNLVFSVSGKISKYIDINPKTLSTLGPGEDATIILTITSPAYIELGKQELTITMKAQKGSSGYTDSKKITLEIHELSLASSNELLNESRELINQLNEANLSSDYLTGLLNQSENAINNFDLEAVRNNYNIIKEQVGYALDSKKIITELDSLIKSAEEKGIDVSESSRLVQLAELSMERREFEQAYKRVKDAQLAYALEVKGEFGKLSYYLKEYPKEISMGAFFFMVFSFGAYNINRLRVIKKKIKKLKEEEEILNELIKVVQNDCFKEKKMSMSEYEVAMKEYNTKLSNVIENLIELETKRVHMLRFTSKTKRLIAEKEKIISLIKELQEDYMKKKKVETRTYELKMGSFDKRLSDIEEKLATIEANKAMRGIGISWKLPKEERIG